MKTIDTRNSVFWLNSRFEMAESIINKLEDNRAKEITKM